MDSEDLEIEEFIKESCQRFPEVSHAIEKRMDFMGYTTDDNIPCDKIETFSQCTTDAIKAHKESIAKAHLSYVSEKLKNASDSESRYIDVYYVESLMWDIKDKTTLIWGWGLIPDNLKKLYIEVWGEPNF